LDTIGVGLAAWTEPIAPIVNNYIQNMAGKPECTMLGGKRKTSPADAALGNGTLCHALDFDDVWLPTAHPTGCTFPAILAAAEAKRASGKELITAQMAAYEVLGKVHSAINGGAGWHGTAVFGTFGAAAGCCKLLGADEKALRNAWGITASSTGGIAG
jgi:2-methylcitrate dehydratase PrpD